jgi:thiol-disulfide isomerase/thioredoxin
VPEKYWLNDDTFDEVVIGSAFDDNEGETILVEFWAEFNAENCFAKWDQIENAKYYRIDIADSPKTKKQYRVRMAPTLIIFKNGSKQDVFKAGLDLLLPTDLKEVQETINEINNANKF